MSRRFTRRSQAIVPFGVGAIVEFQDEALMVAGLEAWPEGCEVIPDERLARRLGVEEFRLPPPRPERGRSEGSAGYLPHVRFPRWHFCPRCRHLSELDLYQERRPQCENSDVRRGSKLGPCSGLKAKQRPRLVPIRFLAVCEGGHIDDFPWLQWAHSAGRGGLGDVRPCARPCLYFYSSGRGGLGGLIVSCNTCPAKPRSLLGSTGRDGLRGMRCGGTRPWLGKLGGEDCVETSPPKRLMALQRGASNIYFPEVVSSLLIPPYSERVFRLLQRREIGVIIRGARVNGEVPDQLFRSLGEAYGLPWTVLRDAFLQTQRGDHGQADAADEVSFRAAEYDALGEERRGSDDLLATRPQVMGDYGDPVTTLFERVSLIERLAETRALVGFRRIEPGAQQLSPLAIETQSWLPALRVYGEGIFLVMRKDVLGGLGRTAPARLGGMLGRALRGKRTFSLPPSPQLVALHTFAHVLINRLSYDAGYASASIRERLYVTPEGHPRPMAGILLYTAAGDADGTLGGLVELGRPGALEQVVAGAMGDARWCASDPICTESKGQGPESLNLAACHACALLPETSCEFQNRLLDRGALNEILGSVPGHWALRT